MNPEDMTTRELLDAICANLQSIRHGSEQTQESARGNVLTIHGVLFPTQTTVSPQMDHSQGRHERFIEVDRFPTRRINLT
jgi:hypothetical protein